MNKLLAAGVAALIVVSGAANASTSLVSVTTTDDVYGPFSGSIAYGATGAAAELSWRSAGYFWSGNIGLTNGAGKIVFDITTANDDLYNLFAKGSGDVLLGTACAGHASVCVVLPSNTPTSLYGAINSVNGGSGICCGGSDILVTGSTVPEPAAWTLLIAGFALTGTALRSRTRVTRTA